MTNPRTLISGGGGGGIGRAITRAFGASGTAVAIADVDHARALEAASEIGAAALAGDVRSATTSKRSWPVPRDAVVFLASPQSSYINGQSLDTDGGLTARGPFP